MQQIVTATDARERRPQISRLVLDAQHVRFRYPGTPWVLDDAAIRLRTGDAVGLLGANGSGKSTFLGAITNSIAGEMEGNVDHPAGAAGPVGYATQDVALYQHLSVAENLTHAARLATGSWRVSEFVDEALAEFELQHLASREARHLSGGQQRLAHLACSFVHRPVVRLLDEPTTALDFATRQLIVQLVSRWRREGIATLVTAHYPEDVEDMCATITLLVDGRTYDLGSLNEYLAGQSRLGRAEWFDSAGQPVSADLAEPLITFDDIGSSLRAEGITSSQVLHSLSVKSPGLRDLLRRDPSLRGAIETHEGS